MTGAEADPAADSPARLEVEAGARGVAARLLGDVVLAHVAALERQSARLLDGTAPLTLDLSGVSRLDTSGAWLIATWRRAAAERGGAELVGASPLHRELIETVLQNMPPAERARPRRTGAADLLAELGQRVARVGRDSVVTLSFLGEVVARTLRLLLAPWRLRATSLVHHMQEIGLNAIPIVSLMAFLIGVVLAFQGAAQLRQFGAEVFVVDLIAISILRELGILLTAIIVAGRTGAAFTAAIGSMKMREEIDAMRTLGLDPVEVLVVPRVLALVLTLPVLGLIADLMGLVGGALMSWIELGVSPGMFRARLADTVDVWHYVIGIAKAPVFAVIIGVVGCFQGLQVGGDAESLGRLTSRSVVVSIFMVIVADALFSIFFAVIGI